MKSQFIIKNLLHPSTARDGNISSLHSSFTLMNIFPSKMEEHVESAFQLPEKVFHPQNDVFKFQ